MRGGGSLSREGGVLNLGDGSEQSALLGLGEGGCHHVTFAGVQRWEQILDDGPGGGGDVDEELAAILRVGLSPDEATPLEVVEQ